MCQMYELYTKFYLRTSAECLTAKQYSRYAKTDTIFMNKQKKHISRKKNSFFSKGKKFKGGIETGAVYGVLLIAVVGGGAFMMLGNIMPRTTSPDQNQQVIIKNPTDNSTNSDLQLKNFEGITLTPTPSLTPTPTPTQAPPTPGGGDEPLPPPGGGGGGGSDG
jgi:hypothetical protein